MVGDEPGKDNNGPDRHAGVLHDDDDNDDDDNDNDEYHYYDQTDMQVPHDDDDNDDDVDYVDNNIHLF